MPPHKLQSSALSSRHLHRSFMFEEVVFAMHIPLGPRLCSQASDSPDAGEILGVQQGKSNDVASAA